MERRIVLPKNIRQIGEISPERRIYLEDYVMTYIRKKEREGLEGCAGLLLGRKETDEAGICFFLTGALLLNQEKETEECWKVLEEEKNSYFPDLELWGYFLIGTMEEEKLKEITQRLFGMPAVVFHIQDGEEAVYWLLGDQCSRVKGYFIFYEKNPRMQKFIAETGKVQRVEEEGGSDQAIVSFREKVKEKAQSKKRGSARYLASSFLILTILLLGVTILNNYDKMKKMELRLTQLSLEQEKQMQELTQVMSREVETEAELESETKKDSVQVAAQAETEEDSLTETDGIQEVLAEIEKISQSDGDTETIAQQSLAERNYSAETLEAADAVADSVLRQAQAVYTIKYGDTLADISEKYYGTLEKVEEICILNEIEDANLIVPGQKIVLP